RVTGLLVPSVPAVLGVPIDPHPQLARQLNGVVGTGVVDQDQLVGQPRWDVADCLLEGSLGLVRRHGDDDPWHAALPSSGESRYIVQVSFRAAWAATSSSREVWASWVPPSAVGPSAAERPS